MGIWNYQSILPADDWVDESTKVEAALAIGEFELIQRARAHPPEGSGEIEVDCEECGGSTVYPDSLDGTTQVCLHCGAYVDVGDLPWEDDFGEASE